MTDTPVRPEPASPAAVRAPEPATQERRPRTRGAALGVAGTLLAVGALGTGAALGAATGPDLLTALGGPAPPAAVETGAGADADDTPAAAEATAVDWGAVAAEVQPGVVSITVRSPDGRGGEGSGVVYDEGLVLTNHHVVAASLQGGGQVAVTLSDGRVLTGEVLGADPSTDLAVVRLPDAPADLPVVPLGSRDDVQVGDPVMAVGNPLGLAGTVTTGIVSALDRPVTTRAGGVATGEPVVTEAIQTDAAVNPGNSGGPLIDAAGRVVGINSSIATTGAQSGSIGLGFAIPVDVAARVAAELEADGTVEHARLGVFLQEATAEVTGDGAWAGTRLGAGVADLVPGSAAADAGIRPGDVVVAVDGRATASPEALTARVRSLAPGESVEVVVARDGRAVDLTVVLDSAAT